MLSNGMFHVLVESSVFEYLMIRMRNEDLNQQAHSHFPLKYLYSKTLAVLLF